MSARTGYEVREGSAILAARFRVTELDREIAAKILRRARIARLARQALDILDGKRA